jgi:MoaA/NifB/PqqE/SkfB family radical SAM enzyme
MDIKATPYSNLKIFAHPDKIAALQKGERSAPIYIRIKPTNICNHRCYYCSYADDVLGLRDNVNQRDQIEWDKMREIMDDLGEIGVKAVTFSGGGEPLVYPHIIPTMRAVLEKGIDLSIITNGQLLSGERAEILTEAKWVRISMDAANRETYSRIRNISLDSFDKVCDNIRQFALKKNPQCELGINFVINHENADQVFTMAKLVRDLGVNHIKFAARITKDLLEYHQPFKEAAVEQIHQALRELLRPGFNIINKYEEDFDTCMIFQRTYARCVIKDLFTVIAADSKVYFCHDKAYVNSGIVGDLKERSFQELWFSKEIRERYQTFDAKKECSHHCVYDDRNILLNNFLSLNQNHINFI